MSGNSTGSFTVGDGAYFSSASGNMSRGSTQANYRGDSSQKSIAQININVAHTHKVTAIGYLYGKTNDTGSAEARPTNFTIKVWKRIA